MRGVDAGSQIPREDEDHTFILQVSEILKVCLSELRKTGVPQDQFAVTTKHAIM